MSNIKRKMLKPLMITASVLLVQFAFVSSSLAKPVIKDLGTALTSVRYGDMTEVEGINNNGQIIGFSGAPGGHAFLWENGKVTDLGTLGGSLSTAKAINNKGQIAGFAHTGKGWYHGFIWEDGKMYDLSPQGEDNTYAYGINDKGQVVGFARSSGNSFIWENGKMTYLGVLGGIGSEAHAINDKGQIVGSYYVKNGSNSFETHAFLWENGKLTDLGSLGGTESSASAINEKGQVVGWSYTADNKHHAFIWENGKMTDLGSLGGNYTSAFAINEKGQVFGSSNNHAFMWEDGKMTGLEELKDSYCSSAQGINDKGQICGYSGGHIVMWEEETSKNSITCDNTVFNLSNPQNMKVTISGSKLLAIKNGPASLNEWDYSVSGNTVTIKKDYLTYFFKKFNYPLQKLNLVFDFEEGDDPIFTATQMPITNYVTSDNSVFDLSNPQDITLNIKGNTLTAIKNGSAALKDAVDYSISGNTVTIKKSYLKYFFTKFTDPWQKLNLEFDFEKGNDPLFSISKK